MGQLDNDANSKRTRVEPIFGWLRDHGGGEWPARLVALACGIEVAVDPEPLVDLHFEKEIQVPASAARLAWMIRNAERLAPVDGRRWREYKTRAIAHPDRARALQALDRGERHGVPRQLILEGPSHADCLIECTHALVWIEGKRNDWLSPSISWDVTRDQLARNLEAAWLLATDKQKDCCLILCHEYPLKHHERLLVDGYRAGTWRGGWPHLPPDVRVHLGERIGTLTWSDIANEWPELAALPALNDLI